MRVDAAEEKVRAMQLLCLTDTSPIATLLGLDLLAHDLHSSPLGVRVSASTPVRFDLILIDGTNDIRGARAKLGDQEGLISTVRGVGYGFARGQNGDEDQ